MYLPLGRLVVVAAACICHVAGLAPTDEYRDADPQQSGYLPNHNMDPAIVDSSQFGQLWKIPFNAKEQFYAKPLTYTPLAGGPQLLFLASSQNWIRTLNAKTGVIINSRQVATPFLQSDIGCTDIPSTIGIIGTPVIDPATDIVYFFAKTYIPNFRYQGATGTYNGVYYFHAVNINTLAEVDGYPILIDGAVADNDPRKYFIGGIVLQRPSLTQVGSVVYAGFGGHCDLFNYTGLVLGVDVNQKKIVTQFVTEAGPLVTQTNVWNQNGGGGQGGIWMSGVGLSSDGQRVFFVSGNGDGHENHGTPASGSSGCRTLGQACASLGIGDGGKLSLTDYFQPYNYENMDGGDQDFGSGGVSLLDPSVFRGTGVSRMAVTCGKNGKIYVLNANNLGGYRLGPGQTDGIIQTIETNKAVFGGAGSYPLEGGYIYLTPVGYPTYVYKLGFSGSGVPVFSQAGMTAATSAGRVGVGIPTVTSFQGKEGTAILWMSDPDAGLRAWHAVPGADGLLKPINIPQVNGLNKFQRPAFGDSRLYVTDAKGVLYCLGSPVNLPLTCTSPVDFGNVALGASSTQTVSCSANIAIISIDGVTVGDANFVADATKLPKGPLAVGATFSFPVTWNLSTTIVRNTPGASYGNTSPGVKSTALSLLTPNAVAGYSTVFPISLTGTEVSTKAFLAVAPINVDYGGIVLVPGQDVPTKSLPFVIQNNGLGALTILGYYYTDQDLHTANIVFTNVTQASDGRFTLGVGFSSPNLPAVGTVINQGKSISVDSTFNPVNGLQIYHSYLFFYSDGGTQQITLEGSASTAPKANISISTDEGGWLPESNLIMDFGNVAPGTTHSKKIRICNSGGSVLKISKSKPPGGTFHIDDPAELHEEQNINVGDCAYGTVVFVTKTEEYNVPDIVYTDTWTLNTDDLNFGVHVIQIQGTLVSNKVGPKNSSGGIIYEYLGCYSDTASGSHLLPNRPYTGPLNTNGLCQTNCATKNYIFSGTEYQIECYCGNQPPADKWRDVDDVHCTFACAGDPNDSCGGVGGYISIFYDPTRYTPAGNPSTGPSTNPGTVQTGGNYNYIGCYSEATNGRALTGKTPAAPTNGFTTELCQAACQGYQYFGTEFGNECYCGNTIGVGAVNQTSSDITVNGCSMYCVGSKQQYCGGANRLDMYQLKSSISVPTQTGGSTVPTQTGGSTVSTQTGGSTGPTPQPSGPVTVGSFDGWNYLGCYSEATASRALSALQNPIPAASVSIEACAKACSAYTYFAVEYAQECYCGNTIQTGSALVTGNTPAISGCNMVCRGNSTELCGGGNRLNMYQKTPQVSSVATISTSATSATSVITIATSATVIATSTNTVTSIAGSVAGSVTTLSSTGSVTGSGSASSNSGSVSGSSMATLIQSSSSVSGSVTSTSTTSSGSGSGSGTSTSTTGSSSVSRSGTSTSTTNSGPVSGSSLTALPTSPGAVSGSGTSISTQSSGSRSGSSTVSSATSSGSISGSSTAASTTNSGSVSRGITATSGGSSTSASPISSVSSLSTHSASGVSSSAASITSSVSSLSTKLASAVSSSAASTTSSVSSLSTTLAASSASSLTAKIPTTSTKTSTTTVIPTPGQMFNGGWVYLGCANETKPRALPAAGYANRTGMTVESCQSFCSKDTNNYGLAGLEYGDECWCANALQSYSAVGATGCSMPCSGNSSEICGGSLRLSVYNLTTFVPPTTVKAVGSYVSKGCYKESTNGRLLTGPSYTNATAMSVESCVAYCAAASPPQTYAAVEYSKECYCSNNLPATATTVDIGACNMLCTGAKREFCGAANRLNLYHSEPSSVSAQGTLASMNEQNPAVVAANTTAVGSGEGSGTHVGKDKRESKTRKWARFEMGGVRKF